MEDYNHYGRSSVSVNRQVVVCGGELIYREAASPDDSHFEPKARDLISEIHANLTRCLTALHFVSNDKNGIFGNDSGSSYKQYAIVSNNTLHRMMQPAGVDIGAMHATKISAPDPPLSGESLREQNKWFIYSLNTVAFKESLPHGNSPSCRANNFDGSSLIQVMPQIFGELQKPHPPKLSSSFLPQLHT